MRSFRLRAAGVLGLCLFPAHWDFLPLIVPPLHAQAPAKKTPRTFSKSASIRLPIHMDDKTRANLSEIKLYVRTPVSEWQLVQSAPATQTSFDYRAEKDGEYSFMFVTVDKSSRVSPPSLDSRPPHQIILVDTTPPELTVYPLPVANRDIFLKCEVRDANPDVSSIKLEYLFAEGDWRSMDLVSPDTPGVFRIPHSSVLESKVRATARDKAGNVAQRVVDLGDPTQPYVLSKPVPLPNDVIKIEPQILPAPAGPMQTAYKTATRPNESVDIKFPDSDPKAASTGYNPNRPIVPEKPEPVVIPDLPPTIIDPKSSENLNIVAPVDARDNTNIKVDPFVFPLPAAVKNVPPVEAKPAQPSESKPAPANVPEVRPTPPTAFGTHPIIGTTRCSIDYAVENVIVGGQTKIEFWATKDNGRSWSRVPDEAAGRSPAKLLLPGDGLYGVRVKANSNGQPPQTGEAPDCWIEVDTIAPTVRMMPPILGTGADAGTLTVQWVVHDKNLAPDSIAIYHASRPDGPWLPIATGLRNEGSYRWLIPAGIGADVFLKLEATDRAGNVGRSILTEPVAMPQPKVRVLNIGPSR